MAGGWGEKERSLFKQVSHNKGNYKRKIELNEVMADLIKLKGVRYSSGRTLSGDSFQ